MKNFLNPNQCRYLASLICVLGAIFAFISKIKFGMNSIHPTFIIGILIIIAGFVFGFIKARCPHCNCLLSFSTKGDPKHCPNCGEKSEDDADDGI